jgi:hypothetical protein
LYRSKLLLVDALINYLLGLLLLIFPTNVVRFLDIPLTENKFYPSVFGAVIIGVAIALTLEHYRKPAGIVGLGLGGAISINMCGGIAVAFWLLFGDLDISLRGSIILWLLVVVLLTISTIELITHIHNKKLE